MTRLWRPLRRRHRPNQVTCDPFFIVGSVRTGSTLLAQLLNLHPHLVVGSEDRLPLLFQDFLTLIQVPPGQVRYKKVSTDPELKRQLGWEGILGFHYRPELLAAFTSLAKRHFRELADEFYSGPRSEILARDMGLRKGDIRRWGDKLGTFWPQDFIRDHYPGAQLIHTIRDGRDVVVSMRHFASQQPKATWGHFDFEQCCDTWVHVTSQVRQKARILQHSAYFELRYEDLVEHEKETLARLLSFLGQEADADTWKNYRRYKKKGLDKRLFRSHGTAASPSATVGRWQAEMTEQEKRVADRKMGPLLQDLGYAVDR